MTSNALKEDQIIGAESLQDAEGPTGSQLRDRSWELLYAAGLDYAPKYITLKNEFNGKAAPIDGLIRTTRGYYRLAEDTRDGTRVLLHSYERGQLTGIEKDGQIMLDPEEATDVYGVSAHKTNRGSLFRYDMERDMWFLGRVFQKDLNLHAEELTIPSKVEGQPDRRKIKLANGIVAFGIVETDEGKWNIRFYKNPRQQWDETASFAETAHEKKGLAGRIFNPPRYVKDDEGDIKEFDDLQEAIHWVRRYWKAESRRLFQGKELIEEKKMSPLEKFRYNASSWALRISDQKILRDWTRALSVAVFVGVVSTAVSGTPFLGAMLAAGSIFGWSFISKSLETATASFQGWLLKNADRQKIESRMPAEDRDYINDYLLEDELNYKRFRKKLSDDTYKHLRLLNLEESDIMHDDADPSPPGNRLRDYERLSSAAFRYFGAQFHTSNDNEKDGVMVAAYPNGLISLVQVDKDTRAARHYLTYNKDFDVFGEQEAYKHLDPKLTRLPGEGDVFKITHRQGKDFRYVPMSCDDFMADLSEKLERSAQDIKAFGLPLRKLFNCTACDGLSPKSTDAIPVEQWQDKMPPDDDTDLEAEYDTGKDDDCGCDDDLPPTGPQIAPR